VKEKMLSVSNQNSSLVKLYSKNSNTLSKHEYLHGTKRIEYFVFRTRRRKTSEIIVDSNEIVIRVPYSKPLTEIEALIKEKIDNFETLCAGSLSLGGTVYYIFIYPN
jgi:hypothetical protein